MAAGRGGAGRGQGRKPGVPNKSTQARIDAARRSGFADPMMSHLSLHDWAMKEWKAALKRQAEHRKAFGDRWKTRNPSKAALEEYQIEQADLTQQAKEWADKASDYGSRSMPYLHARLASVDANINHTNHEDALDELDDEEEADFDGDIYDGDAGEAGSDFED